jgi:hypothetical protein
LCVALLLFAPPPKKKKQKRAALTHLKDRIRLIAAGKELSDPSKKLHDAGITSEGTILWLVSFCSSLSSLTHSLTLSRFQVERLS